jgi:hypothetical protein
MSAPGVAPMARGPVNYHILDIPDNGIASVRTPFQRSKQYIYIVPAISIYLAILTIDLRYAQKKKKKKSSK